MGCRFGLSSAQIWSSGTPNMRNKVSSARNGNRTDAAGARICPGFEKAGVETRSEVVSLQTPEEPSKAEGGHPPHKGWDPLLPYSASRAWPGALGTQMAAPLLPAKVKGPSRPPWALCVPGWVQPIHRSPLSEAWVLLPSPPPPLLRPPSGLTGPASQEAALIGWLGCGVQRGGGPLGSRAAAAGEI